MKKGQALWEVTLFLGVVAAIAAGVIFWVLRQELKKPTEKNNFKDQAQQHQMTINQGGIRLFDISCVPRAVQDKEWGKGENNAANSAKADH